LNFELKSESIGGLMRGNVVRDESYCFALEIVQLCRDIKGRNEQILVRQLLRAGTSIGANVEEALAAQSRADFIAKMCISSKEARETHYWLRLLRDSGSVNSEVLQPILEKSQALINILTAIVKTAKARQPERS
jgi:four helix bundle protein